MTTPALIRHRRLARPFRDLVDPATLAMHYDAATLPSQADGSPITTWADSSGNGADLRAIGASGAGIPTMRYAGPPFSPPVVDFNGDGATIFQGMYAAITTPIAQPCTFYFVYRCGTAHYGALWEAPEPTRLLCYTGYYGYWLTYAGGALTYPIVNPTGWHVGAMQFNGSSSLAMLDGQTPNGTDLGTLGHPLGGGLYVGGSGAGVNSFIGQIAELRFYRGQHSVQTMHQLSAKLSSKWHLPTNA